MTAMDAKRFAANGDPLPWDQIDTVLVDMDGTLLDLAFDNYFWLELVPRHYADKAGLSPDEARRRVNARSDSLRGRLEWYCLDHWGEMLGLDLAALKSACRERIGYLPGAPEFLDAVRGRGKALRVVTNAHRAALAVKVQQTRLDTLVDGVVSSHDFRAAKETQDFWRQLLRSLPFDPGRTLLVEDSAAVLGAAVTFGIRHTVAVARPDSGQPRREIHGFRNVDGVRDLL